jgi:hypothetical protein
MHTSPEARTHEANGQVDIKTATYNARELHELISAELLLQAKMDYV